MSNWEEIEVKSFGLGLVTNVSKADADKTSFQQFKNFQANVPGIGSALSGAGTAQLRVNGTLTDLPALPSGFTLQGDPFIFQQTAIPGTSITEADCIIIFGTKSSRQRFYVWPNVVLAPAVVAWDTSSWKELTEAELVAVGATVTDSTHYQITGLANLATSAFYYSDWIIWNNTRSLYDYISSINTGTEVATTVFGTAGVATGDVLIVMRAPIFKKAATITPQYSVDSVPAFSYRSGKVIIHTGAHDMNSGPDLCLQFKSGAVYFNATGMAHRDWLFEFAHPWEVRKAKYSADTINNLTGPVEANDPLPQADNNTYILYHSFLYDGTEESNIYYDSTDTFNGNQVVTNADGTTAIANTVKLDARSHFERTSPYTDGTSFNTFFSKRITKMRVYLANGQYSAGTSAWRPTTSFYLVKEIDINSSSWSLNGTTKRFEITYTLYGRDWFGGQQFPFESVNGFEVQKFGANANMEAQIGKRTFIAPIFDDTQKLYRVLFNPIRQSGETAPEVYPVKNRLDVLHMGVSQIVAVAEQNGKVVILGKDKLVVGTVTGANAGELDESFHKVGCIALRTVRNIENLLFFSSQEKMFEVFDGNRLAEESPAERIQDIWNALTVAEKSAAFSGVHRDRREYWIAFSDGGVQRIFAYSLKYGIIFEYDSDNTYIGFAEGVDGQLYGATASSIVELVSGSPTESLAITLESQVFNHDPAHYRRARVAYLSPSALILTMIDDDEISALREKDALLYLSQSNVTEVDQAVSLDTSRAAWKLTRAANTDTTLQIDSITLARTEKPNR